MTSWHRHQTEMIRLTELDKLSIDEHGNFIWPYQYCPKCKRTPTSLIAPDPEDETNPTPR